MNVKKIVLILICSVIANLSYAQRKDARQQKKEEKRERVNQLIKQEEEGAIIYQKQSIFGIKLTTDGYAGFYELGKLKTPTKTNLYSLEIGEHKHAKEEKLTRGNYGFAVGNPYIYGKINNFYFAKLGIGQQKLIGGKGNKNGVAVSALYGGGLSAGLLKPYYISYTDPQTNKRSDIKYNKNDSAFLAGNYIIGSAGFSKGFNEMKFVPGAFAKAALRFDYGRYNESVTAIEVGVNAEIYSQKMPIMLLNKEKRLFVNAYAAINFGRRR
jgi:hypothetical protein